MNGFRTHAVPRRRETGQAAHLRDPRARCCRLARQLIHDGSGYAITKAAVDGRRQDRRRKRDSPSASMPFPDPKFRASMAETAVRIGFPATASPVRDNARERTGGSEGSDRERMQRSRFSGASSTGAGSTGDLDHRHRHPVLPWRGRGRPLAGPRAGKINIDRTTLRPT